MLALTPRCGLEACALSFSIYPRWRRTWFDWPASARRPIRNDWWRPTVLDLLTVYQVAAHANSLKSCPSGL